MKFPLLFSIQICIHHYHLTPRHIRHADMSPASHHAFFPACNSSSLRDAIMHLSAAGTEQSVSTIPHLSSLSAFQVSCSASMSTSRLLLACLLACLARLPSLLNGWRTTLMTVSDGLCAYRHYGTLTGSASVWRTGSTSSEAEMSGRAARSNG